MELADGSAVPIVRRPSSIAMDAVPLPEQQEFEPLKECKSQKITTVEDITIQPGTQSWIKVETSRHGLITVETLPKLYKVHLCLAGNGIAQVEPNKPFGILIANFGK